MSTGTGLAFSFPAILKAWLDRVWTPGFAYDLTPEAWRGDINGRQPKLTHHKALIIQTTIFDKRAYDGGLRDAMRMVIDEFTLTYPGIKSVEREYFYAVRGADDATRQGYFGESVCPGSPVLIVQKKVIKRWTMPAQRRRGALADGSSESRA